MKEALGKFKVSQERGRAKLSPLPLIDLETTFCQIHLDGQDFLRRLFEWVDQNAASEEKNPDDIIQLQISFLQNYFG